MNKQDLKDRTKKFAIQTIHFVNGLPQNRSNNVLSNQLLRSCTSVAANYRASLRARSTAEFLSKLNIVLEESDESLFWLEMIEETNNLNDNKTVKELLVESNELTSIFAASLKTARTNANPTL